MKAIGLTVNLLITIDEEEQWETLYFGAVESPDTASTGDFDDDGITNLLERALGSDPTAATEDEGVGVLPSRASGTRRWIQKG